MDTVVNGLEVINIGKNQWEEEEKYEHEFVSVHPTSGFTALDDDLFVPKGYYGNNKDGIPVIFDSGCNHAVAPIKSDFIGKITPVHKQINGLGATETVTGVGTAGWSFRDNYGVMRKLLVKACLIPTSKVRLFSPQQYFLQEGEVIFL